MAQEAAQEAGLCVYISTVADWLQLFARARSNGRAWVYVQAAAMLRCSCQWDQRGSLQMCSMLDDLQNPEWWPLHDQAPHISGIFCANWHPTNSMSARPCCDNRHRP